MCVGHLKIMITLNKNGLERARIQTKGRVWSRTWDRVLRRVGDRNWHRMKDLVRNWTMIQIIDQERDNFIQK